MIFDIFWGFIDLLWFQQSRKSEIMWLWNGLIKMAEDRKISMWSKSHSSPGAKELYLIFEEVDMLYTYRNNLCCSVNSIKIKLSLKFEEKWFENILPGPKLRKYIHFKRNFGPELYVTSSLVAHLRAGILPLTTEVGQYKNIPEENRWCQLCDLAELESDSYFILYCTNYNDLRELMFLETVQQNLEPFYVRINKKWNGCLVLIRLIIKDYKLKK